MVAVYGYKNYEFQMCNFDLEKIFDSGNENGLHGHAKK